MFVNSGTGSLALRPLEQQVIASLLPLAFWWVNHKQTYRQEADGGYLWSLKANANGAKNISIPWKFEAHPADLAGSSFFSHQLEQQGCKQSLNCFIKPPSDLNKKASSLLALGIFVQHHALRPTISTYPISFAE